MKKLLYKHVFTILVLAGLCWSNKLYSQNVTVAKLTDGILTGPLTPGQQGALIGFSVQVSNGSLTFDQFIINSGTSPQDYIANGKLYRSSNGNYATGVNTFVGNAVIAGAGITVSGISETINNTTNNYFFVADVAYNGTGIAYSFQFYVNSGTFAHATNGSSYAGYGNYQQYNFNPTTFAISNLTAGLSPISLILGQTDKAMFGFSIAITGSSTISQIAINSNNANLGSYFSNLRLYKNTTADYSTGTKTLVGNAAISGNFVLVTGLSEAYASATQGQTNTGYYFLVGDYTNSSGSLPGSAQYSFSNGQSTVALTQSYPAAKTVNNFTATGNTYTLSSAGISLSSEQNGVTAAGTTIYGGQAGLPVFGFGVTVTGSSNITQFNINSSQGTLSTYMGNAKLYRSTTNNYTTGTLTQVGTASISGSFVNVTGLSEAISNDTKYYFLVMDAVYNGSSASSIAFNFTNNQGSSAITQTSPSSSYNNFTVSGNSYVLGATSRTIQAANLGLAANLTYAQGPVGVYGFSVQSTGLTTMSAIRIIDNQGRTMSGTFANAKLYRSTTNNYTTGTLTQVGTANFNGNQINITGLSESILNTTQYYFLAVEDIYYSASGYFQPIMNQITDGLGSNISFSQIYGDSKSYALPTLPAVTALTGGVTASGTVLQGTNNVAVFGFSLTSYAQLTYGQFSINSTLTNLSSYFSNFRLYRNTTNTYGNGTPTLVGAAAINGGFVNVTGLAESFTSNAGQTNNYFLVGDYTNTAGTLPASLQFSFANGQATAALTQSAPGTQTYNTYNVAGNTYSLNSALVSVNGQQNGLGSATIYGGQTNIPVFGFDITVTGTSNITGININSNNNNLSTYIGNVRLYRSSTSNYNTGSPVLIGTGTLSGAYASFTGLSESITNGTKYYFLVVDGIYTGNSASTVTFNFASGQATNALIQSNPASAYNNFAVTGTPFTLAVSSSTVTSIIGGVAPSPFTYGQTQIAICGFSVQSTGLTTISALRIADYQGRNMQNTFANAKLYRSTTNNYSTGGLTLVGTVSFSGANINVTGLTESILNTTQYYFLVADDVYYGTSGYFQPVLNQLTSATGNITTITAYADTKSYAIPTPTLTVTGYNSPINGITQGALSYGQTNIVLFGFKLDVLGVVTLNEIQLNSNVAGDNFFKNGKLYRSTDQYFSHATQVSGTLSFNSLTRITGVNEVFTNYTTPTTYYYFIVADLTAQPYFTPGIFQYNFVAATNSFATTTGASYKNLSTTNGVPFNVVNSYTWTGSYDTNFNDVRNFTDRQGYNISNLGSNVVIEIGVTAYTRAPVLTGNASIGGITFGTSSSPTISIPSGVTLTFNDALSLINGSTGTITGLGNLSLASTANSVIGPGSTLNLSGGVKLANAGKFAITSTAVLNLSGNATVSNTGTFTLRSEAAGSATISALSGTSTVSGTYNVERFITGGSLTYRGYRLLSSTVTDTAGYYNLSYMKGSGSYLTGPGGPTNGFDVVGNPTLYLYRDDVAPAGNSYTSGNYRAINNIANTPAYKLTTVDGDYKMPTGAGFMYFFRGNNGTLTTTVPSNVVLTQTGTLNQGQISVKNWVTKSDSLGFSNLTAAAAVQGFNLVGNPYPSSIDWNSHYDNSAGNSGTGIYAPNVGHAVYIYNATTKNYSVYTSTSGSAGIASGSPGGSNIIPAGQGFFVRATAAGAKLTFNESAKVNTQVIGTNLLMGAPVTTNFDQHLRLQLAKDSINKDETVIVFNRDAKPAYSVNEDVLYLKGTGVVSLANLSSDKRALTVNQLSLPTAGQAQKIKLSVAATGDGIYSLKMTEVTNIPDLYDVWLMDAYKKDSLDIKHNANYNFNIKAADTATTSSNRFTLVIRQNAAYAYKLLDFVAKKSGTSNAELSWKVENEADYTYFTVERSTDGGKTFEILASEKATGLGTYSVIDRAPVTGENIYRLKQEDIEGTIVYSNRSSVIFSSTNNAVATADISIFPNPTTSLLNININKTADAVNNYQITITNSTGRIVLTAVSSQKSWSRQLADLLPGSYFVNVVNEKDKSPVGRGSFVKL